MVLATTAPTTSPALGVDAGPKPTLSAQPNHAAAASLTPKETSAPPSPKQSAAPDSNEERYARATIGAPRSDADRDAAVPAYERGVLLLGAHRWSGAKAAFQEALRLDGSIAKYHAALGEVLMIEEDWAGAAAEFTAALLLDVDNAEYKVRLKEARSRK